MLNFQDVQILSFDSSASCQEFVLMLCNACIPQRCSAAEVDLLCWLLCCLLISAAKEMYTYTLASYVITRKGCTATLLTALGLVPGCLGLKSSSVTWVQFPSFVSKKLGESKVHHFPHTRIPYYVVLHCCSINCNH